MLYLHFFRLCFFLQQQTNNGRTYITSRHLANRSDFDCACNRM